MKKRISIGIRVLLICALIVSGVACAASSGKTPVITDNPTDIETPAATTDPVIDDSDDYYPFSKTVQTEPTPEALFQELKDDLTETPERKAVLVAEYDSLVSEWDALLAKEKTSGLTKAEELRKQKVDKRIFELHLMDVYPDIKQALEVNFRYTCEQMRMSAEQELSYNKRTDYETKRAEAYMKLADELEARLKNGEDVETLYLYYFEQVYAINAMN